MTRRLLLVALIVGLALAAVQAGAVSGSTSTAAAEDALAPLDIDHQRVDGVVVDGVRYDVVRYDNVFPWASGYEFFDGGRRVVDDDEAASVARHLAWKRGVEELEDADVGEMRRVARRTRSVEDVVAPLHSAVDSALSHVDALKTRELPLSDRSYWSLAVEIQPELETLEATLRAVEPRIDGWRRSVEGVGDQLEDVTSIYAAVESGEEFSAPMDLEGYRNATSRMREFEDRSRGLESDLELLANSSGSAADDLEDAGMLGGWAAGPFRRTEERARSAEEGVEELRVSVESARLSLEDVLAAVESEESRLESGWSRRQNAPARVALSVLFVLATVVAAALGYRYRRRLPVLEDRFGEGDDV